MEWNVFWGRKVSVIILNQNYQNLLPLYPICYIDSYHPLEHCSVEDRCNAFAESTVKTVLSSHHHHTSSTKKEKKRFYDLHHTCQRMVSNSTPSDTLQQGSWAACRLGLPSPAPMSINLHLKWIKNRVIRVVLEMEEGLRISLNRRQIESSVSRGSYLLLPWFVSEFAVLNHIV